MVCDFCPEKIQCCASIRLSVTMAFWSKGNQRRKTEYWNLLFLFTCRASHLFECESVCDIRRSIRDSEKALRHWLSNQSQPDCASFSSEPSPSQPPTVVDGAAV
ncbi:hypothetical protein T10_3998 [Trichinella papuae]|uniref:Uncharacterized protein n=1 Tax=Trichinella papuae TaxID=268474 RepID=A0A0V1N2H6_9BILA|nr:hypothetical protein T10_3998 [Trichinella papuae]